MTRPSTLLLSAAALLLAACAPKNPVLTVSGGRVEYIYAGGANAADASALGVMGPSVADKKALAAEKCVKWESVMAKKPCRVRTKKPNAWGVYDVVGQGRTICRETEGVDEKGRPMHVQLGPDGIAEKSFVGEWGWNSTLRLALGEE